MNQPILASSLVAAVAMVTSPAQAASDGVVAAADSFTTADKEIPTQAAERSWGCSTMR